jgi:hypothetical protein
MEKARHLRRWKNALIASIVFNSVLFTVPLGPRRYQSSPIGEIVEVLGKPGGAFTEATFPGHGGIQILVMILASVIFYAMFAWLVFAGWDRIHGRGLNHETTISIR